MNNTFSEPEWPQWSSFTACSKTCGEGIQTRSRTCQKFGGTKDCIGVNEESVRCNIIECSGGKNYVNVLHLKM